MKIRRYTDDDVDPIYTAVCESAAELLLWMPWYTASYTKADTVRWVEYTQQAWTNRHEYNFVIQDSAGSCLGSCGLNRLDKSNRTANLGYWVRTSSTGKGIATRAVRLLRKWAFTHTDFHRLEIMMSVRNPASRRVAEKAGAICEGLLRHRLWYGTRADDAAMYVILRDLSQDRER